MRRTLVQALALLLLLLLLGGQVLALPVTSAAQDATPSASPPAGLIVPDPSECTVEPRPITFFEDLIASPPALPDDPEQRFWSPTEEQRPWSMPAGEPADDETIAGVTATLHEALACLNANDPLRFLALFSDDMVRLFFALDPLPAEALPSFTATPVPSPPDMFLGYVDVRDVRILPDGRVAALGESYDPTQPPFGMGTDYAVFVKVGDRWLIDSLIENVVIVGEATATPQS
jgi:hypothetical protein